jgi:hypothetical protein
MHRLKVKNPKAPAVKRQAEEGIGAEDQARKREHRRNGSSCGGECSRFEGQQDERVFITTSCRYFDAHFVSKGSNLFAFYEGWPPRNGSLFVITNAGVVAVLPSAAGARKSESLRGENHSYREGDTH